MVPRNVAEAITPPKVERKEQQVWTPEQVGTFLDASQLHRAHAAFYLALMTGMRRGELLGLHWDDLDWDRSRLKVRHNLVEVRGEGTQGKQHAGKNTVSSVRVTLQTPKTDASRRTVVLSPGTLSKLREHRERQTLEKVAAAEAWKEQGYVFTDALGDPVDPRTLYGWYRALVKSTGLPVIRFHDLRHTAASLMIRHGVSPKTVSDRLGHSDVAFTLRTYAHLYDDQREEAAFDITDLI